MAQVKDVTPIPEKRTYEVSLSDHDLANIRKVVDNGFRELTRITPVKNSRMLDRDVLQFLASFLPGDPLDDEADEFVSIHVHGVCR